eukprot:471567-Prorocentrum_minimum.AAC.1
MVNIKYENPAWPKNDDFLICGALGRLPVTTPPGPQPPAAPSVCATRAEPTFPIGVPMDCDEQPTPAATPEVLVATHPAPQPPAVSSAHVACAMPTILPTDAPELPTGAPELPTDTPTQASDVTPQETAHPSSSGAGRTQLATSQPSNNILASLRPPSQSDTPSQGLQGLVASHFFHMMCHGLHACRRFVPNSFICSCFVGRILYTLVYNRLTLGVVIM